MLQKASKRTPQPRRSMFRERSRSPKAIVTSNSWLFLILVHFYPTRHLSLLKTHNTSPRQNIRKAPTFSRLLHRWRSPRHRSIRTQRWTHRWCLRWTCRWTCLRVQWTQWKNAQSLWWKMTRFLLLLNVMYKKLGFLVQHHRNQQLAVLPRARCPVSVSAAEAQDVSSHWCYNGWNSFNISLYFTKKNSKSIWAETNRNDSQ